ncbi:hypothetical protein M422DRAFT_783698 [Sphaerobolus stellatus SS14]|uniref:Uncharacterized protein n=1 Tax=Sphaerobolus stellatus (strain SS14) TaxID=990650 RepID=A0A0C9V2L6_SPHS4|nr:hypothetical protein M422DRAFT_783698 [Sphaerobolus stellatus SS14]
MEKTTLEALDWALGKGDSISPKFNNAPHRTTLHVRRRFQFSSALKRMSTVVSLTQVQLIAAAKGAPETIKGMLSKVPEGYDETYKHFTRRGSRVLALGIKDMDTMSTDKMCYLSSIENTFKQYTYVLLRESDQQASSQHYRDRVKVRWVLGIPLSIEA